MPKFSIIFIIRDSAELISCALLSIELLNFDKAQFEVIVVDDGSEEPIQARVQQDFNFTISMVYVPRCAQSSRGRARNIGASWAKGEYLVFVDGDHFLEPSLLTNYDAYITQNKSAQVILGKRHHLLSEHFPKVETALKNHTFDLGLTKEQYSLDERDFILNKVNVPFSELFGRWHLFWSCNFCIEKNVFFEVGAFDEKFIEWGVEDTELGYRLLRSGYDFSIIDNYVWHFLNCRPITEEKYRGWIKNTQYFYHKYLDIRILEQLTFDSMLFQSAFMPNKKQKDFVEQFVEFEQKLRFLHNIDYPEKYDNN